jgi:hypothetical protein
VRLLLAIFAVAAVAGCGPVQSTSSLIDADVAVEAARAAGAPASATYEFTAAEAYLHEARVMAGRAQYEAAADFAKKSTEYASTAKKKALAATQQKEAP